MFHGLCYRHLGRRRSEALPKQEINTDPNNLPALFNLGSSAEKNVVYLQGAVPAASSALGQGLSRGFV